MNIAIWIALALVCFIFPATSLTSGGSRKPTREALEKNAQSIGLPITDEVYAPVAERIRRRQRGMRIGALALLVVASLVAILFLENDSWGGVLVFVAAGVGAGLGGAAAIAVHRPEGTSDTPVVARLRSVRLDDYLTKGERIGFRLTPLLLVLGAAAGALLLLQLPPEARGSRIALGAIGAALVLLTWAVSAFALRRVLAAPARSGSELELAWDDVERADGLRQVVNLTVAAAFFSHLVWVLLMGESLTKNGFYRDHIELSYWLTALTLLIFAALILVQTGGSMLTWLRGTRKGYELRRLWPEGVRAA